MKKRIITVFLIAMTTTASYAFADAIDCMVRCKDRKIGTADCEYICGG